jgi:Holliday junction resolvasome RuvABC endonuclease subunit
MYTRRLLAIDPSLTCSGWALFSIDSETLLAVGKIRSLGPNLPLAARLKDLQVRIGKLLRQLKVRPNDVLVCEAPTTMRDPRAALKVEQVRCIFEVVAREHDLVVPGRINPRSVHHEIMGLRGKQLPRAQVKGAAVQVVQSLHAAPLVNIGFDTRTAALTRHQDIVDAILIGSLGVTWVKTAALSEASLEQYFESGKSTRQQRPKGDVVSLSPKMYATAPQKCMPLHPPGLVEVSGGCHYEGLEGE